MPLSPADSAVAIAACRAGVAKAGEALSRALEETLMVSVGDVVELSAAGVPTALIGPGLILALGQECVLALPESSGLLPAWCAGGAGRLDAVARELAGLLLPAAEDADNCAALWVKDIPIALTRGGLSSEAMGVPLELACEGKQGTAFMLWPLENAACLGDPKTPAVCRRSTAQMPPYTRSLLKIEVPITVTLARSKQPLSRIVELAPGSIIPFAKSCDDTLRLEVNNREVAEGEAVKVGDKFGLRITSMVLPPERFVPVRARGQ
jgi:flagellar motor switch/type III secretory pathway protein FliN